MKRTMLQDEREKIIALIIQGCTNKQIREEIGASYRSITDIRYSLPPNVECAGRKGYICKMRDGFWDEWELAVYRLFGGRKRVHLNP